jgi:type I restriction enzyme, S subunit
MRYGWYIKVMNNRNRSNTQTIMSHSEWQNKLPHNWEVRKIKYLFRIVNGSTPSSNVPDYWDGDVIWITPYDLGNLKGPHISSSLRKITIKGLQNCGTTLVPKGSLILSTRAPIGHLGIASEDLCTNQGCKALVLLRDCCISNFYYYVLQWTKPELQSIGRGTTFHELSSTHLASVLVPYPSKVVQQEIAAFLDKQTAKIDALIAKKQRLIELLQEKRTALISQAVTKGLNPDVPMKDSGINWIGEVPKHWGIKRVKYTSWFKYGESLPEEMREDGEIIVYGSNGKVGYHSKPNTDSPCIIVGRKGSSGKLNYSSHPCFAIDTTYFIDRSCTSANLRWLYYAMYCLELEKLSRDSAIPGLNREKVHNLWLPSCSISEQHTIVAFLDHQNAKIDSLVSKIQFASEKLLEYRNTLIYASVIGQIDVREITS